MRLDKARRERLGGAAANEARRSSRARFRGADRVEALDIGQRAFPSAFTDRVFDAGRPGAGLHYVRALGRDRALVQDDQGARLVMASTAPLEAASFGAAKRPVDLGLMASGEGFRSVNPVVAVRIAKRVRDGVALGDDGEIAVIPVSESDVTGSESSDRVFFANTQADTDVVVAPSAGGAEISWQLRSPSSPERLAFDVEMPAGAVLRRARSEHPIPGDPPRAIEVAKDGEALGYVYAPIAYDADQQPVKAEASIDGKQIVIEVDHRDADLRYPVLVDPEVVVVGQYTGAYQPWAGWFSAQQPAPATAQNYNRYGAAMNDPAYAYGLYASMPTNTFFDRSNTAVSWLYRAPPNSYIYRAGFANIAHKPLYDGLTFSRWYQGLLGSAGTSWEPNVTYNNARGGIGPNPFGPASGADSAVNHDFCVWNAARNGCYATENAAVNFTEQNYASFGLHAQNDYNSSLIYTGAQKAYVTMGAAAVFLGDRRAPTIQTQPSNVGWKDDTAATTHTLSARATDPGLGINAITLTGAAGGPITKTAPCNQSAAPSCPLDWTTTTPISYPLNEGTTTLSLKATDEVGNPSPTKTWSEKIDRTPPSVEQLQGTLWSARDRTDDRRFRGLYGAGYALHATASDSRSGVREIEVYVDDESQRSRGGFAASATLDWTMRPDDYEDGGHTVRIVARDAISGDPGAPAQRHTAERTFTVTIDRRGDIDRAVISSGDPAANGEIISSDMSQRTSSRARAESETIISTRDIVVCPPGTSSNEFCGEERVRVSDPNSGLEPDDEFSVLRGTSTTDARLSSVSELKASPEVADVPTAEGAIEDALEPWQRPPPGHGSEFIRFDASFDEKANDGTSVAVTQSSWFDKKTRLQLRRVTQSDGSTRRIYFDYSSRLTLDEAGTAFSVPRPASPGHVDETQYRESTPSAVSDRESGAAFIPLTLGLVQSVSGAVWCSATRQLFTESTAADPPIEPAPDDPPSDESPEPFTPITAYDEEYRLVPTVGDCNALDFLRGLSAAPLNGPSLTISAYARNSGEGQGWIDTYQHALENAEGSIDRTGSRPVHLLGQDVIAVHLPLGEDELAVMIPTTSTVYTIKGKLLPTQIADLLALLSPVTGG